MKKTTLILFLSAFFFLFIGNNEAKAQCKQQMVYRCATKGRNAIYLRDFNTKLRKVRGGEESGTKWTVVLNRGTRYRFILCTPPEFESKVELTLFDSQHPERTKPWGRTESNRPIFDYVCGRSGMYYVSIRYKEGYGKKKTCAVGIMSFVGKNQ
ncbi:MAG: hypothetical protein U9N85_08000 [Bacteroidota bacterium]|nr:hypothetical protein [Bacteroidota bacterium]